MQANQPRATRDSSGEDVVQVHVAHPAEETESPLGPRQYSHSRPPTPAGSRDKTSSGFLPANEDDDAGVHNFSMALQSSFALAMAPAAVFVAAAEEQQRQRERELQEEMFDDDEIFSDKEPRGHDGVPQGREDAEKPRAATAVVGVIHGVDERERDSVFPEADYADSNGNSAMNRSDIPYRPLDAPSAHDLPGLQGTVNHLANTTSSSRDTDAVDRRTDVPKENRKRTFMRRRNKRSTKRKDGAGKGSEPKQTPLPVLQISILVMIMMTESIGAFMLLPFVGLYVAFLQDWTAEQSGYLAGVVVASYMLGQFLSSKFWGYVSDRYGRKVPLIGGLWICAVMMLLFGLSTHVAMACIVRFIQGLANGCVLIGRTVVAEITDSTNVAKAFSCISFSWGFGSCIGSVIGGYLYDPVSRMGADPNGFFSHFPAFLPALVCSLYMFLTWGLSSFFLIETNARRRPVVDVLPKPAADWVAKHVAPLGRAREAARERLAALDAKKAAEEEARERTWEAAAREERQARRRAEAAEKAATKAETTLPAVLPDEPQWEETREDAGNVATTGTQTADATAAACSDVDAVRRGGAHGGDTNRERDDDEDQVAPVWRATEEKPYELTLREAFRRPGTRYLTLMVGLWAAADVAYMECLPLWGIASKEVGGLGVYSDMVSILTLVMAAPTILANLAFPWLCKKFTDKTQLFRWAMAVWIIFTCVIPAGGDMHHLGESSGYWYVFVVGIPRQATIAIAYGVCWLLVPRVAPPGHIGETNGFVNSAAALFRCVTPFPCSALFAVSVSSPNNYFPYNHFLVFLVSALLGVATFVLSFFLHVPPDTPPSAQPQGEAETDATPADDRVEVNAEAMQETVPQKKRSFVTTAAVEYEDETERIQQQQQQQQGRLADSSSWREVKA